MLFNIQRWSLHDGPGIRTTVFFKGCPLRCRWCSNPESWKFEKELFLFKNKCTSCGNCVENCPEQANIITDKGIQYTPEKCKLCLNCIKACPNHAREIAGMDVSVKEILNIVQKDSVFYRKSGGGVTFSGGEPFSQMDVLNHLVEKCEFSGIHTSVETSGYFDLGKAGTIIQKVNHLYMDLKHINDHTHKKLTGISNKTIIQNIIDIDKSGKPITLRIPLVKDLTDTDENIARIIEFAKKLNNLNGIELLNYHNLGVSKYESLGLEYNDTLAPSEKIEKIKNDIKSDKINGTG